MNRLEHLLATLAEEATEVTKEAHKCQRFGIHNHFEGRPNGDWLMTEMVQLMTMLEMVLEESGYQINEDFDTDAVARDKREKVEKHMHLAETIWGTVEPGSSHYWKRKEQEMAPVDQDGDEENDEEEDYCDEPDTDPGTGGTDEDSGSAPSGEAGPSSQP